MKKIDDLLPDALKLAQKHLTIKGEQLQVGMTGNREIDDRRKADIASFGTSLMQSGLLPAVALFSDTSEKSGERRNEMLNVLFELSGFGQLQSGDLSGNQKRLLTYVLNHKPEQSKIRSRLMDAVIALKLAVRTFHLKKIEDNAN